jgi:integrase
MSELLDTFAADQARRGVRSRHENARSLKKELLPLRVLAVADVSPALIDVVIRRVEERGAPTEAARLYGRLNTMFQFALSHGYINVSPLDTVSVRRANNVRTRLLEPHELRAFMAGLDTMVLRNSVKSILLLQLLLGARVSEVAGVERGEVDLQQGQWQINGERTKNGSVHVLLFRRKLVASSSALAERRRIVAMYSRT